MGGVLPVSQGVMQARPAPDVFDVQRDSRAIADTTAIRKSIYDGVLGEMQKLPPIEAGGTRLELRDLQYADPDNFSIAQRKKAILRGETLGRRIRGTISLLGADGKPIDERTGTVLRVPYLSDDGAYIINGVEYSLASQQRLKPGIYSRIQDNGDIEAHVNVLPGHGPGHRVSMDPETGVFKLGLRTATYPLYSMLKAFGKTDDELKHAWGDQIWKANAKSDSAQSLVKLFTRLSKLKPGEVVGNRDVRLREEFERMRFDPDVMKATLGHPYDKGGSDPLLATTKKLLALNRGEADPDDRDHSAFQVVMGPEDLFKERATYLSKVLRPLAWRAAARKSLNPVQSGAMTNALEAVITRSGLGNAMEQVSPVEVLDHLTRVTRMGVGGIGSSSAIPLESRSVQPSQLNYIDMIRTPESMQAGVDSRFTSALRKGKDGKIYAPFRDARTSALRWITPEQASGMSMAFPGELEDPKARWAIGVKDGKIRYMPRDKIDISPATMDDAFNHLSNLVPAKSASKGQRLAMGSRMSAQALSLAQPEAPWVQTAIPFYNNRSYEEEYGSKMGAVHALTSGVVEQVEDGRVVVRGEDGQRREHELRQHYPYNRKSYLHNTPVVQPGQTIRRGDLLASSNFTDGKGTTSLGTNLRTAFASWRGLNFEDAILLSESAANKKLVSNHLYQHTVDFDEANRYGKRSFLSLFPGKFNRTQFDTLDDDGVVKVGTKVQEGDPLVLQANFRPTAANQVTRSKKTAFTDHSQTWGHSDEGVVTDVEKTPRGVNVVVKSSQALKEADKVSARYGNKGVVRILPDNEMPQDSNGQPFEMVMNPLGLITRVNANQVIEMALGKIARKTGKPYKLQDFDTKRDWMDYVRGELAKNGMSMRETIIDPKTGRKIPGILTGEMFTMKLHHQAESKAQGRDIGGYTSDQEPSRSGDHSAKRLAMMESWALLSHGAYGVLRDKPLRGQENLNHWAAFMRGETPPATRKTYAFDKFLDTLRAAGINPVRQGERVRIQAMTNKDVDELAGDRNLDNAETVDWKKDMHPIQGGLFDQRLTGGHRGKLFSAIKLEEPMPSPVFEEPIRKLLGLTEQRFRDVLAGKDKINGLSGPNGIQQALEHIDIDREIAQTREIVSSGRKTARDEAVRKLRYLKKAKELDIAPKDWVLNRAPVLPPAHRPVSLMLQSGQPMIADVNYLYRELMEANENLREMKKVSSDVGAERLALYDSFNAVTGLGDPVNPKLAEKNISGLLHAVFGSSGKFSTMQRKLLSGNMDFVARAVITPEPDFDMDEVGVPENKAWEVYRPFVVRRLARRGVSPMKAMEMVEKKDNMARRELLDEMKTRPVYMTRAPVLHRYGVMSFWPKIIPGNSFSLNPLVIKGYNADFDGDQMNLHVPIGDDAVRDATEKMLPSKNLRAVKNFRVHQLPINEFLAGLWNSTTRVDKEQPERVFKTEQDAIDAYENGEISATTPVRILDRDDAPDQKRN